MTLTPDQLTALIAALVAGLVFIASCVATNHENAKLRRVRAEFTPNPPADDTETGGAS